MPGAVLAGAIGLAASLSTATPAAAQPGADPLTTVGLPPYLQPITAAMGENAPGLGRVLLGEGPSALPWLGALAVPLALGLAQTPPVIRQDFRGYYVINPRRPIIDPGPASYFTSVAVKISWLDMYQTYQLARARIGNATFQQPLVQTPLQDILLAPFLPQNLADWRVWATVGLGLAERYVGLWLVPDPPPAENPDAPSHNIEGLPEAPPALEAKSAQVLGFTVPTPAGLALDMASIPFLAYPPAMGEEALFRGVVQAEFEHGLGPLPGLTVMSGLFGAIHLRPGPWPLQVRRFVVPFVAEMLLGVLYQQSGYDITKPMAARFWFDTADFAQDFWRPDPGGVSVIGIRYTY